MSLAEIEGVFRRAVVVLPDKENPSGETRFRAIGTTPEGRNAFIVFTLRMRGAERWLRPISARYMHRAEVEAYEKAYSHIQIGS